MPSLSKPAFTANRLRQPTNFSAKSAQKPNFEYLTIYENLSKLVNIKSLALNCAFCSSLFSHETMICQISKEEENNNRISCKSCPNQNSHLDIERQERAGMSGSTIDDWTRPPYRLHSGLDFFLQDVPYNSS